MPEARAYLGDGRLELDNNICERSIRPVAPGRKNCLFLGSVGGGEAAAIAYALIETAKMNNVDPEAWLTWVLERVADHGLTPSTNLCRGTGSPKTSKTRPDRTDTALATQAEQVLAEDPYSGHMFVFRGRRGDLLKIIWWDGQGACLFSRRLERGRFVWPAAREGKVSLSPSQLSMLLEGIDWRTPQKTWRPLQAG